MMNLCLFVSVWESFSVYLSSLRDKIKKNVLHTFKIHCKTCSNRNTCSIQFKNPSTLRFLHETSV